MKKPFIFEGRDKTMRTGHEKIAKRNIMWACYNSVGMTFKTTISSIFPLLTRSCLKTSTMAL